ncbi:MAG: hypothetical protein QXO86_03355 [Nitrososphaerota archaeon]
MGALYRLGLAAAAIVLAVAGVLLLSDWPVELGGYSVEICREAVGAAGGSSTVVCEEREFSVLRGSPVAGILGVALLALSFTLLALMVREYLVRGFVYLAKRLVLSQAS